MSAHQDVENPLIVDKVWERFERKEQHLIDCEKEEVCKPCAVCGKRYFEEDLIPSERWEDYFLCDNKDCHDKHYLGWQMSMEYQKFFIKKEKVFIGK